VFAGKIKTVSSSKGGIAVMRVQPSKALVMRDRGNGEWTIYVSRADGDAYWLKRVFKTQPEAFAHALKKVTKWRAKEAGQ
jgi:hypothetical protein